MSHCTVLLPTQAEQTFSTLDPEEQVEQITELTQRLVQVTEPRSNKSLLPNNLEISARIVADVITVLENNNSTNEVKIYNHLFTYNKFLLVFIA